MRKFAIFSSSLILKEKLLALQVSTEQRIFKTLDNTKKKGTRKFK